MSVSIKEGLACILKESKSQLLAYLLVSHAEHQNTILVSVMEEVIL
jgi:hypothetical protein